MTIANNYPTIAPSLQLNFAQTRVLDPRITFTRASTATYYDATTSALAEQNLFIQSQNIISGSWNPGLVNLTGNSTTAPDGTTTASLAVPTTTSGTHNYVQTSLGNLTGTYTVSIYVKASGYTTFIISNGAQTLRASYDLTAVTATTTGAVTASITASTNGFYLVTYTATLSASNIYFFINSTASYAGDGTSGVYVWGAQIENRSSVTAYTATTTQPITNYIPVLLTAASGVPRFDCNPTTRESLGLEIEEQRTNLVTYSSDFSNAAWTKNNSSITTTANIAPDGTQTAQQLIPNTSSAEHKLTQTFTATAASNTITVYAKAAGYNWIIVQGSGYAWFDVLNGTVGTQTSCVGTITAVGNGWYRCSIVMTSATSGINIWSTNANGTTSFAGNGFSGTYFWGVQVEAGAFATSYIPTVASQVTRAADSATMTGTNFSSWYNISEGTMYVEFLRDSTTGATRGMWSINDATTNNAIDCRLNGGDNYVVANGVTQADIYPGAGTAGVTTKNAFAFKTNDFSASTNAGTVVTDTLGIIPTVTQLRIGGLSTATGQLLGGTLKKIAYYPLRLTNTQLQALTGS